MPEIAPAPNPGSFDPRYGLRVLSDMINEALVRIGALPRPALAPAGGWPTAAGTSMAMAIDLDPAARGAVRRRREVEPAPIISGDDQGPTDYLDEQHSETWALVHRAQGGDGDAFGLLYDRYLDTVFRFVYFRVNDRALAEDITSETFLRALRRISSISYQGRDIGAWFVTIARNIILDHMKSARHRLEITTADSVDSNDREPSTEEAVLESLQSEYLMAAVRQLGDEQRECVMLRFIQGYSVSETAAVMGKNDGAIKALQHRAVRKLAELVGGELR
jgi:RNA polymerase sigma-70 factor (ECF subfamily)